MNLTPPFAELHEPGILGQAGADAALAELLTAAEAADLLKVRPATIRAWAVAGNLAASRLPGGKLRICRAAVAELLAAGRIGRAA